MILDELDRKGLITPPPFLISNCMYLTVMGSHSYGVADTSVKESLPDKDVYGFCIPPKDYIFPNLRGEIEGFGSKGPRFEQWQQPHILDKDAHAGRGQEYDFQIFNIVKYFELCRDGNPNMLDSLFTREEYVLHCSQIGRMVRDSRSLFVSKRIWTKMRGYAFSQLHKMNDKGFKGEKAVKNILCFESEHGIDRKTSMSIINQELKEKGSTLLRVLSPTELVNYQTLYKQGLEASARFEIHKFHGFDVKFAYHVVRLFDEAAQLLETGTMDLQRAKEAMKAVRRGEWTIEKITDWAKDKEKELDIACTNCHLPAEADEKALKQLLINCLEMHYGSLQKALAQPDWSVETLKRLDNILNEVRTNLYA